MKHLLATVGIVALSACSQQGEVYRSYFGEAGSLVDTGSFGNASMHNQLVMTGERGYAFSLSQRFSDEVLSTVNFAFNSSQLDEAARETLRKQAAWIRQFPEVRFKVYGHTDAVGSASYNRGLGLRRAQAAVSFLSTQGIQRSRLEAVSSFGETQPLVVTEGRERRNRRTVTEVSGFVERDPTLLNGKYADIIFREYVVSATPTSNLQDTLITTGSGG